MVQTVSARQTSRAVATWLLLLYLMVFAMVIVGGATRLTGSGLSMVQWHPLMGALPPSSESDWIETFQKYQASPQYQLVNHWMLLSDFKRIFLWEYAHRLLGRLIGVVFLVPWLFFLVRRSLDRPMAWKTFVAFLLGGAQGLLGWFMVKSGLVDNPRGQSLSLGGPPRPCSGGRALSSLAIPSTYERHRRDLHLVNQEVYRPRQLGPSLPCSPFRSSSGH